MKIAMVAQHASLVHARRVTEQGPDELSAGELTRALARHGHQVTVFTRKQPGAPDHAVIDGVRIEQIEADGDPLAQVPAFSDPMRARWRREPPDVVHALNWTSGLAALSATRDLRIPVVQTFSSLGVAEQRSPHAVPPAPARLRLERAIGRSADAVVATSTALASDLARLGVPRKSVRCIPWGVDTTTFSPEGPVARRNGKPRLLAIADLTEREPLETLIWALTKVPGAELLISGGPDRRRLPSDAGYLGLSELASSIGLAARVTFTGRESRNTLPALLRSADVVLSTCSREPSGLTSLEAMACGRAVLAPPTGGHADAVVDGTTGIIIPPGRPMVLAQRIRQLLAHPMLLEAYGLAASDRVRSRYSWDRIATETTAVYDMAAAA